MWSYQSAAVPLTSRAVWQHLLFRRRKQWKSLADCLLDNPPLVEGRPSGLPDLLDQFGSNIHEQVLMWTSVTATDICGRWYGLVSRGG